MTQKILVLIVMLIVGWGLGSFYIPKPYKPVNEMASDCNYISKYDFYDYEEAVLKMGDDIKLDAIMGECGVDKYPYIIILYDVYHQNVCTNLWTRYYFMRDDFHKRKKGSDEPIRQFVKSVLTEYADKGDKDGINKLQYFLEDE